MMLATTRMTCVDDDTPSQPTLQVGIIPGGSFIAGGGILDPAFDFVKEKLDVIPLPEARIR